MYSDNNGDAHKDLDDAVRLFCQMATVVVGGALIVIPLLWVFLSFLFELFF